MCALECGICGEDACETKQKHDMDVAEQNGLVAEQWVKKLCDSATFATVTWKQVDSIHEKMKNRLTVQLIRIYFTEGPRGQVVLEKLRDIQRFTEAVQDLVRTLGALRVQMLRAVLWRIPSFKLDALAWR